MINYVAFILLRYLSCISINGGVNAEKDTKKSTYFYPLIVLIYVS